MEVCHSLCFIHTVIVNDPVYSCVALVRWPVRHQVGPCLIPYPKLPLNSTKIPQKHAHTAQIPLPLPHTSA